MTDTQIEKPIAYPSGQAILQGLKQAGIRFIVSVPDIVTSDGLLWPISKDPDFHWCGFVRRMKAFQSVRQCPTTAPAPYY